MKVYNRESDAVGDFVNVSRFIKVEINDNVHLSGLENPKSQDISWTFR